MDLISSRTIEITKLGMDGLMDRQHAISSKRLHQRSKQH